jgi:hypothetical protein
MPIPIAEAQTLLDQRIEELSILEGRIRDHYRRYAEKEQHSVDEIYIAQEFNWDVLPRAQFLKGEIEAIQCLVNNDEINEGVVEFAIHDDGKYPGYVHGYYHGLVEVGLRENDSQAQKLQQAFDNRPRYAQLVLHVRW